MKERVFIDLFSARVMADEYHFDPLVIALEEEIQQDEKALCEILALLVHRTGYIHQTEHHSLARRLRLLHAVHVTQVEWIDERNAPDAPAQMMDFFFEHLDLF